MCVCVFGKGRGLETLSDVFDNVCQIVCDDVHVRLSMRTIKDPCWIENVHVTLRKLFSIGD